MYLYISKTFFLFSIVWIRLFLSVCFSLKSSCFPSACSFFLLPFPHFSHCCIFHPFLLSLLACIQLPFLSSFPHCTLISNFLCFLLFFLPFFLVTLLHCLHPTYIASVLTPFVLFLSVHSFSFFSYFTFLSSFLASLYKLSLLSTYPFFSFILPLICLLLSFLLSFVFSDLASLFQTFISVPPLLYSIVFLYFIIFLLSLNPSYCRNISY